MSEVSILTAILQSMPCQLNLHRREEEVIIHVPPSNSGMIESLSTFKHKPHVGDKADIPTTQVLVE